MNTTKRSSSSRSWQRALGEKCIGDLVGVSRRHTLGVISSSKASWPGHTPANGGGGLYSPLANLGLKQSQKVLKS